MRRWVSALAKSGRYTYAEMAEMFGVSEDTVMRIAHDAGHRRSVPWSKADIAFLKENYYERGARACAIVLCRNYQCVSKKARELGLSTRVGPYGRWRVIEGGGRG